MNVIEAITKADKLGVNVVSPGFLAGRTNYAPGLISPEFLRTILSSMNYFDLTSNSWDVHEKIEISLSDLEKACSELNPEYTKVLWNRLKEASRVS